jgi:hypothetical protein
MTSTSSLPGTGLLESLFLTLPAFLASRDLFPVDFAFKNRIKPLSKGKGQFYYTAYFILMH